MAIAYGWAALGGVVSLIAAFGAGYLKGGEVQKTRGQLAIESQTVAELREDLSRASQLAEQERARAEVILQSAIAQDAIRAAETPKIVTRWRTFTTTLEMSDDEILEARLPADVSRSYGCLFDPREGTGECDGSPDDPFANRNGGIADQSPDLAGAAPD